MCYTSEGEHLLKDINRKIVAIPFHNLPRALEHLLNSPLAISPVHLQLYAWMTANSFGLEM